jgi:hypothetical protein
MIGRTFQLADNLRGARPTMVLSADVWRQQFSSDPAVVGQLLTVGTGRTGVTYEVIGVMPPDFRIPAGAQVWTALEPTLGDGPVDGVRAMYAIGRLASGATVETAVAELSTIARNEALTPGVQNTSMRVVATPLLTHVFGPARPALLAISGASGALLLIACANAAALLLVHGAGRRRDLPSARGGGRSFENSFMNRPFCPSSQPPWGSAWRTGASARSCRLRRSTSLASTRRRSTPVRWSLR